MALSDRQYTQIPDELHLEPLPSDGYASARAGLSDDYYNTSASYSNQPHELHPPAPAFGAKAVHHHRLNSFDRRLKFWIRVLKLVARIMAAVLSITTFVPLAMTLAKYYQTKDQKYSVDGQKRTAWPANPTLWYTYMYFGVSLISMVLNSVIILAYCRSIEHANKADDVAGWWSNITLIGQIVFYGVAVGVYRYGKEPVNGHFTDLWGWSCSSAAAQIQVSILNVNFAQSCQVQVRILNQVCVT